MTPDLPDADIEYIPNFLDEEESRFYFRALRDNIHWRHDRVKIFGKWVEQPRLTAWHGDEGRSYTYSGLLMSPEPWTKELKELKERIEAKCGCYFNSVLLNLYRNGQDSVGWHSDDEPELGPEPVIASLSLGAVRRFILRHKKDKTLKHEIQPEVGSLIIMKGPTQHYWQHQVPKTAKEAGERINLTFRRIGQVYPG